MAEFIDPVTVRPDHEMDSVYDELAERVERLYTRRQEQEQERASLPRHHKASSWHRSEQVWIGISGTPGAGKSTLAAAVAARLNSRACGKGLNTRIVGGDGMGQTQPSAPPPPPPPPAVVLPMDGYHFSKAALRNLASSYADKHDGVIGDAESTKGKSTTYEELMARRGAPWTFDAEALCRDFSAARASGEAQLPTYVRAKGGGDPVPGGAELYKSHKYVLCEGIYLLALDDARWAPLGDLWDDTWFVAVSPETACERLVRRHLETWDEDKARKWGEGAAGARAKAEANDLKNAVWINKNSRHHAKYIIKSR